MDDVSTPSLRRTPVQQRSAERLARILDACAELLDETGYEDLTTSAVADRADVPIGSVYRFFPNKRALADALAARNLDDFTGRVTRRLAAEPAQAGWRRILDSMLEEYVAMMRTVPGFAQVDFEANDPVAARLCDILVQRLSLPVTASLQRSCLVAVEAADALLQLAFRTDPDGDAALLAETRTLLHAYLSRTLDLPSAPG